ncbi:MAG: ATP-binding protein [Prevotella sp.]|nr:ATP-binding protein [Prevotella sp.]
METVKQIPYGVADFESVMNQNLYYVDKTMYLAELENQPRTLIFIRPRRFGKSLFISMMRAYYDKSKAEHFEKLFGSLWIGSHPTPLRNHYQVLYLDFSRILGNIDVLEEKFNSYCCDQLNDFIDTYRDDYPKERVEEFLRSDDHGQKLNLLLNMSRKYNQPLYLIIDEYDSFTNIVFSEQVEETYFKTSLIGKFYSQVFKMFKGMFERIFLTGVSPVTLDDLTSGFNIGWNVSMAPELDKMLGFSTEDVRQMFTYYKEAGQLPADSDIEAMITEMKPWYDNYCFAEECLESDIRVFNCDMVLYYLRNYISYKHSPEIMLDPNTKTDYKKLNMLIQLDKLDGNRHGVMMEIIEKGEIAATLVPSFSANEMTDPETFPSLLFYYGMLTIKGTKGSRLILGIPNNNVRKQYYNYILKQYAQYKIVNVNKLQIAFVKMSLDGFWQEPLQYMADCYKQLSSVRDSIEGERNIQGFFLAYLSLNDYYITAPEVELNHGYCDFFLLPNMTHYQANHSYILELKDLSKSDYSEEKAENQWAEAVEQINGYAVAPRVEALRQGTQIHKIIMQFCGWELVRMEEI